MNFFKKKYILGLVILLLVFILFIIYKTFPYVILKENIVGKINSHLEAEKIPLKVEIKNVKPYWMTGVQIHNLVIKNQFELDKYFTLDFVEARVALLPLFFGKISINLKLVQKDGTLNAVFFVPIFDLINNNFSIEKAKVVISKFSLDDITKILLKASVSGINYNAALLEPIVNHINFGGNLEGLVTLSNYKSLDVDLNLKNSFLGIDNESLDFPKQEFSQARIKFKWDGKNIEILKETEISSKNIEIDLYGNIDIPSKLTRDPVKLNLFLSFSLSGEVENNFGFLIPQLLNCPGNSMLAGYLKVQLTGTVNDLTCR